MEKSEKKFILKRMVLHSVRRVILKEAADQGNKTAHKLLNEYNDLYRHIRRKEKFHIANDTSSFFHQREEIELTDQLHKILMRANITKLQSFIFLKRKAAGLEPFDVNQHELVVWARKWEAEFCGNGLNESL